VAITMCLASRISPPTATALGPAKRPRSRITSTPRLFAWAVVNALSLYAEHGSCTFQSVHVKAARRVALVAHQAGAETLVSAAQSRLGLSTAI
jgi:hypothetical protein